MDEVAAEFGGDFNAEDAECAEKRSGATMRSYCAGKGRVIASAQDAAALGEWPRLRGPDTVIAEVYGGKADARVRGSDSDRHALRTGGRSV